jgi:hypothetical protein
MNFFKFIHQEESIPEDNVSPEHKNNIVKEQTNKKPLDIKLGTMVKVVYLKDSIYNYFKGYLGEVKALSKNKEYAILHLHACPSYKTINVPLDHFIVINE